MHVCIRTVVLHAALKTTSTITSTACPSSPPLHTPAHTHAHTHTHTHTHTHKHPTLTLTPLPCDPGYPFDIPPRGAGLLAYCTLAYHLPLVVPFSLQQRGDNVWGGCMLFRSAELRDDAHGILEAWREGGYSDDLLAAAACAQRGAGVFCPAYAIFPQW